MKWKIKTKQYINLINNIITTWQSSIRWGVGFCWIFNWFSGDGVKSTEETISISKAILQIEKIVLVFTYRCPSPLSSLWFPFWGVGWVVVDRRFSRTWSLDSHSFFGSSGRWVPVKPRILPLPYKVKSPRTPIYLSRCL